MTSFKDLLNGQAHRGPLERPSVSARLPSGHALSLLFTAKDVISDAAYEGPADPWLSSLCELLIGKDLQRAQRLGRKDWEEAYGRELAFRELWGDQEEKIFFRPLELLRAALDKFQGREWPYKDASPLICRCFGVRESDVLEYLNHEEKPTIAGLGVKSKAAMGCRSCIAQLESYFLKSRSKKRYYKDRTYAEWLVIIDEKLKQFPEAQEWKMEVESFKESTVVIGHLKQALQKEEEIMAKKLQGFLSAVDPDLGFFLARSRQR